MKVSCGVVIINENGKFLICHPTGGGVWSLPKGIMDENETPEQAAKREVKEETGIDLSNAVLKDMGEHSFRPGKNIHLFMTKITGSSNLKLVCTSYFDNWEGISTPEVDNFKWVNWSELGQKLHAVQFQIITQYIFENSLNLAK